MYLGTSVKNYEMLMNVHILYVKEDLTYHKGLRKVIDCDCEKICSDNVNEYILTYHKGLNKITDCENLFSIRSS